jgi:hypothetical protein
LVFKHLSQDARYPWKRNAAVVCVIAPAVGVAVAISAMLGRSAPASFAIVVAQVVIYVAAYGRLVRGRWTTGQNSRLSAGMNADVKT